MISGFALYWDHMVITNNQKIPLMCWLSVPHRLFTDIPIRAAIIPIQDSCLYGPVDGISIL